MEQEHDSVERDQRAASPRDARTGSTHDPERATSASHDLRSSAAAAAGPPSGPDASQVLSLQRTVGNAATGAVIQRRHELGAVNAPAEREADAFAAKLAPRLDAARQPDGARRSDGVTPATEVQVQRAPRDGREPVGEVSAEVTSGIRNAGRGRALPDALREPLEHSLGVDLTETRIHTDGHADALSSSIDARAFTVGHDVFFADGEYQPSTAEGRHTIAHEAAHVAQQQAGTATGGSTIQRKPGQQEMGQLLDRASKLDQALLADIAAKAPLIGEINRIKESSPLANEVLKQQILVSKLPIKKLAPLVDQAVAANGPTAAVRKALDKGGVRSSSEVYGVIDACRSIVNDLFRHSTDDPGARTSDLTRAAPSPDRKAVADLVRKVAQLDLRNTHSPLSLPHAPSGSEPARATVGVVGAGPIGLMAAIEARLQGAEVVLFEGRDAPYSRRQVLALDPSTEQKLAKLGVKYELLDEGTKGSGNKVAVKYIEKALSARAAELGIQRETGWTLTGVDRAEGATKTTATFQVGDDQTERRELDLLVVAAGPGIDRKGRYGGASIASQLGITYDVQEAKDYAVTALFEPSSVGKAADRDQGNWAYRFDTPKVTYVLRQIPKELYDLFTGEDGEFLLRRFIQDRTTEHYKMGDMALAKERGKAGNRTPNVGVFPIEIRQAQTFVNEQLRALVIGDSAATPHPHTGSGFNTGVRELDGLADVVASLQSEVAAVRDLPDTETETAPDPDEESPSQVVSALQRYDAEMRRVTDVMIQKALVTLAKEHGRYLDAAIAELEREAGTLLQSDPALAARVSAIRTIAADARSGSWDTQDQLDFLVQAQKDVAELQTEVASMRLGLR